ncbi:unnamed protein product, partial [Allacma fusca]
MESSKFIIPEIPTSGLARNFEPPPVTIIGSFSNDSKQNFIDGAQNLKYVEFFEGTKRVFYDLNKAIDYEMYERYERDYIPRRKEANTNLAQLLQWINLHDKEFLRSRPDFVMLRSVMEKVATTSYHCRFIDYWRLGAIKKNGTIYFQQIITKEQLERKMDSIMIKPTAWGYMFKKFILADEPNEQPDPRRKVSPGVGGYAVLKTIIGGHNVLYSTKLDGVCAKEGYDLMEMNPKKHLQMLNNCHLVVLKTCSKIQQNKLQHWGFRKNKSRRWWVQGALGGVSNFVVGYRDDVTGLVRDVENIPIQDLYKKFGSGWYGETGFQFLGDFLSQVKQRVLEDETVYVFSFNRNHQMGPGFEVNFEVSDEGSQYFLSNL